MGRNLQIILFILAFEALVWAVLKLIRSLMSFLKVFWIEKHGAPARSENMACRLRPVDEAEINNLGIREPADFCYVMTLLQYYEKREPDGKITIQAVNDARSLREELDLFCVIFGRYPKPFNDNMFTLEEYASEWPHYLMWEVYYLIGDTTFLASFEDIKSFVTPSVISGIPVSKELETGLNNLYREIHEKRFAEYE